MKVNVFVQHDGLIGIPEKYKLYTYGRTEEQTVLVVIDNHGNAKRPLIKRAGELIPLSVVESVSAYLRSKRAIYSSLESGNYLVEVKVRKEDGEFKSQKFTFMRLRAVDENLIFLEKLDIPIPRSMELGLNNLAALLLEGNNRADFLNARIGRENE